MKTPTPPLATPIIEPVNDLAAEQVVLACCIDSPNECMPMLLERVQDKTAFYLLKHQIFYTTLKAMWARQLKISPETVQQYMKEDGVFEEAGGWSYLSEVTGKAFGSGMLPEYLEAVIQKWSIRKMAATAAEFHLKMHSIHNGDTTQALLKMEMEAAKLLDQVQDKASETGAVDVTNKVLDWIQTRHETSGAMAGIPTGFTDLDRMIDGIQYGEHTIIAAGSSVGKTAISMDIVRNVCIETENPIKTLFITCEMTPAALARRLVAQMSRIPISDMKKGILTEGNFKSINLAQLKLKKAEGHLVFHDAVTRHRGKGITASEAAARIESAARKGCKLVIIDYLQKILPDAKHEKRTYEIGAISTLLTGIARNTGIALISLAQLNRDREKDKSRRPHLGDIADSYQLVRDGDLIMLLHRNLDAKDDNAELIVAKQRDGATGIVSLKFQEKICRFENPSIGY